MRGVIYVDILFFVNALIGYFLLRGAALLAGLATGVYGSLEETAAVWQRDLTFEPQMEGYHRTQLLAGWHKAVERSLHWAKD